jgi:DNA-binding NarL/FixJ family response regulator
LKILILEDRGERIFQFKKRLLSHDLTFTDKPKEAIQLLQDSDWDYIFLDHDMKNVFEQPGEGTGYEVAQWISEHPDRAPRHILIHTMNNVGAAAMMLVLGGARIRASYIPILWERVEI